MFKYRLALPLIAFLIGNNAWGYCPYQDCGSSVMSQQLIFQKKLTSAFKSTDAAITNVEDAYKNQITALKKQNEEIERLEKISARNNLLMREIAAEMENQASLLATQNELIAKKAEALHSQAVSKSAIAKIKAEDP